MMDASIEKLERLMSELKVESVNSNEDETKRQCLTLVICNGRKTSKKNQFKRI